MSPIRKIVWSLDPFEKNPSLMKHSIELLRSIVAKTGAHVYPVHVVSDGLLSLSVPKSVLTNEFKPLAEQQLKRILARTKLRGLAPAKVLVCAPSSRSDACEAIDRYARSLKADAIFLASHGRSGLSRVFLGSFAETMVLHAKTPVILSGPKNANAISFKRILFPTDFAPKSKKVFDKVLSLAKKTGAELTVLSAVPHQFDTLVQSQAALFGGGIVRIPDIDAENLRRQEASAAKYKVLVKKAGVKGKFVIDVDADSVVSAILKRAGGMSLIAMASESGAFSAAVLGSIGRVVAREAPCAVWFFRSA